MKANGNKAHFKVTQIAKGGNKGKYRVELISNRKVMCETKTPKRNVYGVRRWCHAVNPNYPIVGDGIAA